MNDNEILELLKKSPKQAYSIIIRQYANLVYAIVLNKIKNCAEREDIEDCVSDVFVSVFRSFDTFDAETGTIKSFISMIAKRTAIDAFRKLSYRKNITSSIEGEELEISGGDTPDNEYDKKCSKEELWAAVNSLGEPDTTIIVRQFFYDQTVREISERLSMSVEAVQKRSIRARKKLREILRVKFTERGTL